MTPLYSTTAADEDVAAGKVTKIADFPPFRIGDVFPADQKSAALLRFVVATQPLLTISRLLRTKDSGPVLDQVDGEQMLLAAVADSKEAMDAFRDADALGCFAPIAGTSDDDMKKRLERLRRHSDPKNASSLYKTFIEFARHNAGGHWSDKLVRKELKALEDVKAPVWVGDRADGAAASGYYPLAHELARRMSRIFNVSKQKQLRRVTLLSKLQGDLFHVAGAAYSLALKDAYAKKQWT